MITRLLLQFIFLFLTVAAQVSVGGGFVDENGTILYHENLAVTENGYYVEAKDLKVGNVFIGANGELTTLTATSREEFPEGITVYNFSVEGNHNYYVIANLEAYENGASVVLVHNAGYRAQSNPARGRFDYEHNNYDNALVAARSNAGELGDSTRKMYDSVTRTLLGEMSQNGKRGWRIDSDHVNWWDWTAGKKGTGGQYGHEFFPPEQSGPFSSHRGYANWE
jgi:hypothetical protein